MAKNLNILKCLFGAMCLYMIYLVFETSFKSNFFEAVPRLNQEPWFVTTIVDFYFNIAIISAWVIYKEQSKVKAALWIISFICLGSITTLLYVLKQIFALKNDEPLSKVLLRNES